MVNDISNLQVTRSEILPPLGNAMGFVYGDKRNVRICRKAQEIGRCQPLRRNIYDLILARFRSPENLPVLRLIQRRVDERRRNPGLCQRRNLILHQRYER